MTGTKATFLENWALETGHGFLRFDYTGHGQSSGILEEGCISAWAADARDAIRSLTNGPQVLVGSSMGGWISLLLAKNTAVNVAGIVGIAAAPDFTEDFLLRVASPAEWAALLTDGRLEIESEYAPPYIVTANLIADGAQNLLLNQELPIQAPIRLLHGTADREVPVRTALRILDRVASEDARLSLVKDADHRMSGPAELALLRTTLEELLARVSPST